MRSNKTSSKKLWKHKVQYKIYLKKIFNYLLQKKLNIFLPKMQIDSIPLVNT